MRHRDENRSVDWMCIWVALHALKVVSRRTSVFSQENVHEGIYSATNSPSCISIDRLCKFSASPSQRFSYSFEIHIFATVESSYSRTIFHFLTESGSRTTLLDYQMENGMCGARAECRRQSLRFLIKTLESEAKLSSACLYSKLYR